jgi:Tol biopolymer transport system component
MRRTLGLLTALLLLSATPANASSWCVTVVGAGDGDSLTPVISANGRFVAFPSEAADLVRHDSNGASDVFVEDRWTGSTTRVSVSASGAQADGASFDPPAISADGRYVAFVSSATNLVPGDTDGVDDVFVKDRRTGAITLAGPGYGSPALSADGRYLAFRSGAALVADDTNNLDDVFVRDLRSGTTTRVSTSADGAQGDRQVSHGIAISADGRHVAFPSAATNLVPGDTNASVDMFVKDRRTGAVTRANTSANGTQTTSYTLMPAITPDGRTLAFVAWGDTLVPGDTEDTPDIFVKNLDTGAITRVNTASDGTPANAQPYQPSISADGRVVVFASLADNLVRGDTNNVDDVFRKDLRTGRIERVGGEQGNGFSVAPSISADGRTVVFSSAASNLVRHDRNDHWDIFAS